MPLIRHDLLDQNTALGIWDISEAEGWFMEQLLLYPAELRQLSGIKGRRRVEWLAARQLVHQMSGRTTRGAFIKDDHGKPHLDKSAWHISISHSHHLAAAIASSALCGIDIQFIVPKITRLAHKFIRPEEKESLNEELLVDQLHFYWGAKEALYKAYGRRQLDFIEHIHVRPFSYQSDSGQTSAQIVKDELRLNFDVFYERLSSGFMLVWCKERV